MKQSKYVKLKGCPAYDSTLAVGYCLQTDDEADDLQVECGDCSHCYMKYIYQKLLVTRKKLENCDGNCGYCVVDNNSECFSGKEPTIAEIRELLDDAIDFIVNGDDSEKFEKFEEYLKGK